MLSYVRIRGGVQARAQLFARVWTPPVYEAARGPITRVGGSSGSFCCAVRMHRSILAETLLEESSGCVLSLLLLCIPVIGAGDI